MSRSTRRLALVAHPGSRRALGFAAACRSHGPGDPRIIPWEELLSPGFDPERELGGFSELRIETPADDLAVERLLLARGAAACRREGEYPVLSEDDCKLLPGDDGRLRFQRQWYLGWCGVLDEIASWCQAFGLRAMNSPAEIAVLFDKDATRRVLEGHGIQLPPASGICRGYDDMVARMDSAGWDRVFLKPCHGSSASGVMAIARSGRGKWRATTSAVLQDVPGGTCIRNSKRLQRLDEPAGIRALVDVICRERALLERWFPKATLAGRPFDLRVLCIGGKAAHVVVRSSDSPITNLHLGNQRGDLERVIATLGPQHWQAAMDVAEAAAASFPGCHYSGVDLMVGASRRSHAIAEVNAFGDLLHRDLWRGMNPWEAELSLWPGSQASPPSSPAG